MANVIKWFEIPASDFDRAIRFYNTILDLDMEQIDEWGYPAALFPNQGEGVTGALVFSQNYEPTEKGTIIYFEATGKIESILEKVGVSGGKIETPKTSLGAGLGYFAVFYDSEGNKLGLHSDS